MRARLAILSAKQPVELREVVLRDKPAAFLETSPSATVPCLKTEKAVLDESLEIMVWALNWHDPDGWMDMPERGHDLIAENDGPFKDDLDRYKYASRFPEQDHEAARTRAAAFVATLETRLNGRRWIFGDRPSLADMAILPFVRQFAHVDTVWFDAQPWTNAARWLSDFKSSPAFASTMSKYMPWAPDETGVMFP